MFSFFLPRVEIFKDNNHTHQYWLELFISYFSIDYNHVTNFSNKMNGHNEVYDLYIPQNSFDPQSKVTKRTNHHPATLSHFEIFLPALAISQNMETQPFFANWLWYELFRKSNMIVVYADLIVLNHSFLKTYWMSVPDLFRFVSSWKSCFRI